MPYPRRLLQDDEDVVFDSHPHWISLAWPVFVLAVVLAGCIAVFVKWTSAPTGVGVGLGVVVLLAFVYFLGEVVSWRSTRLVVTSQRVISRAGVWHRFGREIPITRVQDVTYHQRFVERLVGAGCLVVESAGDRGVETIASVREPETLQVLINRMQANATSAPSPHTEHTDHRPPMMSQMEQLDELHRRGILTEHEFAQKKAELLQEF